MEIFSNPLFDTPSQSSTNIPLPSSSPSVPRESFTQNTLNQARTSVSSFMSRFKPFGKSKKKEEDKESLAPQTEHPSKQESPTAIREIPLDEADEPPENSKTNEVDRLRYEMSLLLHKNQELQSQLQTFSFGHFRKEAKENTNDKEGGGGGGGEEPEEVVVRKDEQHQEGGGGDEGKLKEELEKLYRDLSVFEGENRRLTLLVEEKEGRLSELEGLQGELSVSLGELKGRLMKEEKVKGELNKEFAEEVRRVREEGRRREEEEEGRRKEAEGKLKRMEEKLVRLEELEKEHLRFQETVKRFESEIRERDEFIKKLKERREEEEGRRKRVEGKEEEEEGKRREEDEDRRKREEDLSKRVKELEEEEARRKRREEEDEGRKREEEEQRRMKEAEGKRRIEELQKELADKEEELLVEKDERTEEKINFQNDLFEMEQKIRNLTESLSTTSLDLDSTRKTLSLLQTHQDSSQVKARELEVLEEHLKKKEEECEELGRKLEELGRKMEEEEEERMRNEERSKRREEEKEEAKREIDWLKSELQTSQSEKDLILTQLLDEKKRNQSEKMTVNEQKRQLEHDFRRFEGSIQEKEGLIQELMSSLLEKESFIRNSVIEKEGEMSKLKSFYEKEIQFHRKNEEEKNLIYDQLMEKLITNEKLLQNKQNTLNYFQENYQKTLKEKEAMENAYRQKQEKNAAVVKSLEEEKEEIERKLEEVSEKLEKAEKQILDLRSTSTTASSSLEATLSSLSLEYQTTKMSLESQIREKEAEIVLLRQELSKERLFNEEKVDELKTKMIKIEQEYQNKLLEMSRGGEREMKEGIRKLESALSEKERQIGMQNEIASKMKEKVEYLEKSLAETRNLNRELSERPSISGKGENMEQRDRRMRGFEEKVSELQKKFKKEIEDLALQKQKMREDYEIKLEERTKELTEVKINKRVAEERYNGVLREKDLLVRELNNLKEKGGSKGDEAKEGERKLKVEIKLLNEELNKLRLALRESDSIRQDLENKLSSLTQHLSNLENSENISQEKVKHSSKPIERSIEIEKEAKIAQRNNIFKEIDILRDANGVKEKVMGTLQKYERLLEAIGERQVELNKYFADDLDHVLQSYGKLICANFKENEEYLKDFKLNRVSKENLFELREVYLQTGGENEKEINEIAKNTSDFLLEFWHFKGDKRRNKHNISSKNVKKSPINRKITFSCHKCNQQIESFAHVEKCEEKNQKSEENLSLSSQKAAQSLKVLKVLEKLNSKLGNLKNSKVKEKMIIFCIIVKSFLNNESLGAGNIATVMKEIEDLKEEMGDNLYLGALIDRVGVLLAEEEGDKGIGGLEDIDSDYEN